MRRGGRLVLLLGIVIAVAAALGLLLFLQQQNPNPQPGDGPSLIPTEPPKHSVIVARIDIPNNSVLTDTETYLQPADIAESEYSSQASQYFTSLSDLQGKVTVRQVSAGQPIKKADVTEGGLSLQIPAAAPNEAAPKAFAFPVNNLSGVVDQIRPGDFVDVIASFRFERTLLRPGFTDDGRLIIKEDKLEDMQSTKTLVQNVQVLRIVKPQVEAAGTPTPGGSGSGGGDAQSQEGPPETDSSGQQVGANGEGGASPNAQTGQTGDTLTQGSWYLVIAVTDQEAEIIKLAREKGSSVTLVLRGRGDTAVETTTGATIGLLVSQYGLPLPEPPGLAVFAPNDITPVPTAAGAPTGAPAGTPTPTP